MSCYRLYIHYGSDQKTLILQTQSSELVQSFIKTSPRIYAEQCSIEIAECKVDQNNEYLFNDSLKI